MTDVLLQHAPDGGDIEYVNGQVVMSDGLDVCAYLALFGGNELDSGDDADTPKEWWGNKIERVEARKYRSRLQHLLQSMPLVPANLRLFEDAAALDLQFLVDDGIATYIGTRATMPALNTIKLEVLLIVDDVEYHYVFTRSARDRAQAAAEAAATGA